MPFRERIRRVIRRGSKSSSSSSSLSPSSSSSTTPHPDPSLIYQPWEKMPAPKYRRPVAPEHKEKLEAFSFANAWRRKSIQSLYSPMGSRMPSRRNSLSGVRTPRRSFQERRGEVRVDEGTDEEGDIGNVGLSRQVSNHDDDDLHRATRTKLPSSRPHSPRHGTPFNAEDLTLALKRSHLDVPR